MCQALFSVSDMKHGLVYVIMITTLEVGYFHNPLQMSKPRHRVTQEGAKPDKVVIESRAGTSKGRGGEL